MLRRFVTLLFLWLLPVPAVAASTAEVDRLFAVLRMSDTVAIMREEGLIYGDELAQEMFGDPISGVWDGIVSEIHDADRMLSIMADRIAVEMDDADIPPVVTFFESPLGERILDLEIEARRTLLDPAMDDAGRAKVEQMYDAGEPRLDLIEDFITANDLIEMNVAGALNSNLAFYLGLFEGGGLDVTDEGETLAMIWAQEPEVREQTVGWMTSYLVMSYDGLSDDELRAYIAFSETDAGRKINLSLFAAYADLFDRLSRELGFAAGRFMQGEDI